MVFLRLQRYKILNSANIIAVVEQSEKFNTWPIIPIVFIAYNGGLIRLKNWREK